MGRNRKKKRRLRAIMAGEQFQRKRRDFEEFERTEETFDYKTRTRVLPEEYPSARVGRFRDESR